MRSQGLTLARPSLVQSSAQAGKQPPLKNEAHPVPLVEYRYGDIPLRRKLEVGSPDDPLEREAELVAERVMGMPDPSLATTAPQRKCACGGSGGDTGTCSECAKKEELQRSVADPAAVREAPPIVHDALGQPGTQLDANTRAFFESPFRSVPIHTGSHAANSAQSVNALAYTIGRKADQKTATSPHAGEIPAIVHDVLQSPGKPLDTDTRALIEPKLADTLGDVRIYTDDHAAASAEAVSANAYTVGNKIVFNHGQYAPHTDAGRRLVSHELAHVVQQSRAASFRDTISSPRDSVESNADLISGHALAGGRGLAQLSSAPVEPMPRLLRQAKPPQPSQEAIETDDFTEAAISLYDRPETRDLGVLVSAGKVLQESFTSGGPKTRATAARILLDTNRVLHEREKTAHRDPNGALLRPSFGDEVPWAEGNPHHVEEIDPFTPTNVARWTSVALSEERPRTPVATQTKPSAISLAAPAKPPEAKTDVSAPVSSGVTVETSLRPDDAPEEKETAGGGEITAGLASLKSAKISDASNALERRAAEITPGANAVMPQSPNASLFAASRATFYIGNRIYVIDRSGHIVPASKGIGIGHEATSEFAFDLAKSSLKSGTYFVAPFAVHARAGTQTETASSNVVLKVDGGRVEAVGGDIFPRTVTSDLVPLLEIMRAAIKAGGGIAIIVSSNRKQQSLRDFSIKKVAAALARVPTHLRWAIRRQIDAMTGQVEAALAGDPETLAQFAFNEGLARLTNIVPPLGAGLQLYQKLTQIVWIADTLNIAAYALTEDEVDLSAQGIAFELAGYIIGEMIDKIKAAASGVRKALARTAPVTDQELSATNPATTPAVAWGTAAAPVQELTNPPRTGTTTAPAIARGTAAAPVQELTNPPLTGATTTPAIARGTAATPVQELTNPPLTGPATTPAIARGTAAAPVQELTNPPLTRPATTPALTQGSAATPVNELTKPPVSSPAATPAVAQGTAAAQVQELTNPPVTGPATTPALAQGSAAQTVQELTNPTVAGSTTTPDRVQGTADPPVQDLTNPPVTDPTTTVVPDLGKTAVIPKPVKPITVGEQSARIQELRARQLQIDPDIRQQESLQRSAADQKAVLEQRRDSAGLSKKQGQTLDQASRRYDAARTEEDSLRAEKLRIDKELAEVRRQVVQPKTWQEHESSVFEKATADHPEGRVGKQVTFDVTDVATNTTVEILADVAVSEHGEVKIIEAKLSESKDLTVEAPKFTDHQNLAYRWISNGNKVLVVPKGANAPRMGLPVGDAVKVSPMIEVHVNSPEGIRVRLFKDTI